MTNSVDAVRVWALFSKYQPNFSGAAIQGHRVLRRLACHGFSVSVLAAGDQAARSLRGMATERDGISIRYLPVVRRRDWKFLVRVPLLRKLMLYLNSLASDLSMAMRSAWMLLREGQQNDIVQLYGCNEFSVLPVSVARARGMHPVIRMTLMGADAPSSLRRDIRRILGILKLEAFHRAEAIVSLSSSLTNSCHSAGLDPDKIVRIPNGVDLQVFHPLSKSGKASLRQALGLRPNQRYIVFVGSADSRKGIDVLIRAFIQVARRLGDVASLIVGPCDFTDLSRYELAHQQLVDELKEELEHVGYSSRVHWVGKVDNVPEYLQAADIFCLPTRREGFPTAIAEALAVGLPVVASRLDGVTTDIIRSEGEGMLISGHDPNAYAGALMGLLKDPAKSGTMGNAARARIVSEFNLESTEQLYAQLYRHLAGLAHD